MNIDMSYSKEELAWVSTELVLLHNIHLVVNLIAPGKIVIKQHEDNERWIRTPVKKHKNATSFHVDLIVPSVGFRIKIYSSTQPKNISYAYI